MRIVRRLYFYLMALVSLEVVIWGVITLARTIFSSLPTGGTTDLLASGLALVIVSLPIFVVHWRVVQHDALQDSEERSSRLRALFLYSARLATLMPVFYSLLEILNRNIIILLGRSSSEAMLGAGQTLADNLIAVLVNLAAWVYFNQVLSRDWQADPSSSTLKDSRRLYRYVWVVYSLGLTIIGVQQVLGYIFYVSGSSSRPVITFLGNGLAFLLIGLPIWVQSWLTVQRSLDAGEESRSTLRLVILYTLALVGAATFLTSIGFVLSNMFKWLLGQSQTLRTFLDGNGDTLSIVVPFGAVWAYFHSCLMARIKMETDALHRTNLKRPYLYILSLAGSTTVFFGAWSLVAAVVEIIFGGLGRVEAMRSSISDGLSMLAIGLPLWLQPWLGAQGEANQPGDIGDYTRRSVVRKGYLYFGVFVTVVGGMVAAGMLFYLIFTRLLEGKADNFVIESMQRLTTLLLVLVWFGYHLRILLQDGKMAHQALGNRHAIFPALVFEEESGTFAADLAEALQRQAPRLPLTIHDFKTPLSEASGEYRAIVLPTALALNPPEALRTWLKEYPGQRLLAPLPIADWLLLGTVQKTSKDVAKETAAALRLLAEGQAVRTSAGLSPWMVVGIVLGILFGIPILISLIGMLLIFKILAFQVSSQ